MTTGRKDSTSQEPPATDGGSKRQTLSQYARAWTVVLFAFLSVAALALFLFDRHRRLRQAELDEQFSQAAAQLGREIEIKLQSYRQVVDNVTRILTSAASDMAEASRSKLQAAEAAKQRSDERKRAAATNNAIAQNRRDAAKGYLKQLEANLKGTRDREKPAGDAYLTAYRAYLSARESADAANATVEAKVSAVESAVRAVDAAIHEEASAQQELSVAERPAPAGAVQSSASGEAAGSAPPALEGARRRLSAAQQKLASAKAGLSRAQQELAEAETQAELEERDALHQYLDADRAWYEFEELTSARGKLQKELAKAQKDATSAEAAEQGSATEAEQAEHEAEQQRRNLDQVQGTTPAAEANRYVDTLEPYVVTSHRRVLRARCLNQKDLDAAKRCVASVVALLNQPSGTGSGADPSSPSSEPELAFVQCPSQSSVPSISPDGRYLILPPARAEQSSAVCGRLELGALLPKSEKAAASPFDRASLRAFEQVLVLESDGTTLHAADQRANLRLSALPGFKPEMALTSRVLPNLELGAGKYRGFVQPVRLRFEPSTATSSAQRAPGQAAEPAPRDHAANDRASVVHGGLALCGLVREARFHKSTFEISLSAYLWVVLFVSLSLLALPLTKLWLVGARSRIRAFDVTALASTALLISLLGVVLLLGFAAHHRLGARSDGQLEQVTAALEQKLSAELERAALTLAKLEDAPEVRALEQAVLEGDTTVLQEACAFMDESDTLSHAYFEGDAPPWAVCEKTRFDFPPGAVEPGAREGLPDWNVFFVTNDAGYQQVKLVPDQHASTPIRLSERSYFQRALRGEAACLDPDCSLRGVAELVRSATSRELVLIVARSIEGEHGKRAVVALETPVRDLQELVLPLGFQAAVVDEDGTIMLHSNNEAHQGLNLTDEVASPEELRAALAARVPETVDLRYLGELSRARVQPLGFPGLNWSVLTIAPVSIVDVATVDMVVATLFGFGVLLALIVVSVSAGLVFWRLAPWLTPWSRFHPERRSPGARLNPRFRPDGAHSRAYARAGLWMLRAAAAVSAFALVTATLVPAIIGVVAALVVAALGVRLVPGLSSRGVPADEGAPAAKWHDDLPLTYLVCCAGLVAVVIVAPATAIFAGVYDHVVDNLIRAEQDHYAHTLRNREACLTPGTGAGNGCGDVFWSGEERAIDELRRASLLARWPALSPRTYLADQLPPLGPAEMHAAGRLYRAEGSALEGFAPLYASYRSVLDLELAWRAQARAATSVPALVGMYRGWRIAGLVLASAATLAAAYVVAHHSLKRLFFLDHLRGGSPPKRETVATLLAPAGRKVLLLFPTQAETEALLASPYARELSTLQTRPGSPETIWIVCDLELLLGDAAALERVAAATRLAGTVVLLSQAEPLGLAPSAFRKRWASALEGYETVVFWNALGNGEPSQATMTRVWLECDERERRLLWQLATDGYANPHPSNEPALRRLAARGLLHGRTFTIADARFSRFVQHHVSLEEQVAWEDQDRDSPWKAVRVPLSTGVVSLLAALTVSKPELGVATALVPTLTAGLPSVLKMLLQILTSPAAD